MNRELSGIAQGRSRRTLLIAGPTASGKSALALSLAAEFGGMIINADSMQVYNDLRIITARPTLAEEAAVPHRLYGHIDAAETYSVGRWLNDVRAALDEAASTSRIPIIVGGTGLYFKALLEGLAAVPPIPSEIRAGIRARLELEGAQALHANLARQDPVSAAKIPPADGVRIARALEVLEATGRPLTDWHATGLAPVLGGAALVMKVFLAPDRAELRRRIDARFDAMLAAGALEEVRALVARRLEALHPPMKAHGVPWLAKVLAGAMPLVEAAEASKTDTRHYTKRQFTWFRRQLADWPWIPPSEAGHAIRRALEGVPA